MHDALAMLELDSIARGYRALDALVKEAPVSVVQANLVEPGRFLILFGGGVAEVESSHRVGREIGAECLRDEVLIPFVRPEIWSGIAGAHRTGDFDTIGIVEGSSVAAILASCDQALKMADVALCGLRLSPALGGKAYYVFEGLQHDVEAAVEAGTAVLTERDRFVKAETVARPHPEFLTWILTPAPFGTGMAPPAPLPGRS